MATPYNISVSQDAVEDLQQRLKVTKFSDELDSAEWSYGCPLADIKRLTNHWANGFDWRKAEAKLNNLPNHQTKIAIDGFGDLNIHFVYQKSAVQGAIPLLFCHGWPGSFIEVKKILPLLTKGSNSNPAFHVVAPSLPNYGFSDGVKKAGFGLKQYAETCHKLMVSLGYSQYVTQGGDWGFYITRCMGRLYPESCLASHVNMVRATAPEFSKNPIVALQHSLRPYTTRDHEAFARTKWFQREGSGYALEQCTKPQTLGYGLTDSPVALLAWIYEKLHDWTDSYPWTDDEILTWISIYWFSTAGPAASVRIYYETTHPRDGGLHREEMSGWIPNVKLGLAHFPKELICVPKTWGRTLGPVVYESESANGGHFAAWERPDVIVSDLQKMFGRQGPCYGIIRAMKGYGSGEQAKL